MPQGDSFAIRLEQLVDQLTPVDLLAVRTARLRALGDDRRRLLDETLEALDDLLDAIDLRAELISTGEVAPVALNAPDTQPEIATPDEVPNVSADPEVPPDERPTVVMPAIQLPDAEVEAAAQPPTTPPTDRNEAPTRLEMPAVDMPPPPPVQDAAPLDETAAPEPRDEPQVAAPPVPSSDTHEKETVILEAVSDWDVDAAQLDQATEPVPDDHTETVDDYVAPTHEEDEPPTPGWTRSAELLYDDMLRLFRLGDSDGALISLERLLTSSPLNGDLEEFVSVNEDRLLELYHAVMGPWERIPDRVVDTDGPIPPAFLAFPKIGRILHRVDGHASIDDIMATSSMSRLETVAVLSQLVRSKLVTTEAA